MPALRLAFGRRCMFPPDLMKKRVAEHHPEWLYWGSPEGPSKEYLEAACYHLLCYNTSYLDFLAAQVEEVMERYDPCEIFLDISDVRVCHCPNCQKEMLEHGEDPENPEESSQTGVSGFMLATVNG